MSSVPGPDGTAALHQHPGASEETGVRAQPDVASVVRAEEQLRIDTQVTPVGTVRLRKRVETRTVTEEVVLHSERLRVERVPVDLTNIDALHAGAEIGEATYEVVLRDEELVATKVVVPREVVRLSKDVVRETVLVEAELGHEEVDVQTEDLLAGPS